MPRGRDFEPGPLSVALANILSDEARAQGVTHEALGAMVGMSRSQVSKSLRPTRVMDAEQLFRLCAALGLDLVEVVTMAVETR